MNTKTKYIDSLFCSNNIFNSSNYKIDPDKIYCLNIVNDFFDPSSKLTNLPTNIIKIYIDSKNYSLDTFDSHVYILSINMIKNLFIVPSNIKKLYLSDKYLNLHPNILHFLSYGIETLELKIYGTTEINLNYLPESINKIIIILTYYNSDDINKNTKIILDKVYSNLKIFKIYDMCTYINQIRVNNIDGIKKLYPSLEIIF
jgi:hypothetical protein